MRLAKQGRSRRKVPAALHLEAELDRLADRTSTSCEAFGANGRGEPPGAFSKDLLARPLAYSVQEQALGGLSKEAGKYIAQLRASEPAPCMRRRIMLARRFRCSDREKKEINTDYLA